MSSKEEEKKKADGAANTPKRQIKRNLEEESDPMTKVQKYLREAADLWRRMRKETKKQGLPMAHGDDVLEQLGYVTWYNEEEKGVTLELQASLTWRVYADGYKLQDDHGSEDVYNCVKHIKQLLEERGITGNK